RPSRTASRCVLRLKTGDRKRMPEDHALHVARCTTHEKGEGFGPVRGIEGETVRRRETTGPLPLRRRETVALPYSLHHRQREAGCEMRDAEAMAREQSCPRPGQAPRPPAIRDDHRGDA